MFNIPIVARLNHTTFFYEEVARIDHLNAFLALVPWSCLIADALRGVPSRHCKLMVECTVDCASSLAEMTVIFSVN